MKAAFQEFKDAQVIHLYKRKGDRTVCDNHRGISLLAVAGKILAHILVSRLSNHILGQHILPESQCGFRSGRGMADMIFAARQLQEKCLEQQMDLYLVFIDLTKAFDTVNRAGLWLILEKFGCPAKFVEIIKSFHEGMTATVVEAGQCSASFPVSNGTKQGCVMAPLLFSIFFSAMLIVAFKSCDAGIPIEFRTDGNVFNLRRLQAKTRTLKALIRELLFADDCALASHMKSDAQAIMDRFFANSHSLWPDDQHNQIRSHGAAWYTQLFSRSDGPGKWEPPETSQPVLLPRLLPVP